MTEAEVLEAMAYAEGSWGKPIAKLSRHVWAVQISDLSVEAVRRAIDECAVSSEFPPTPQHVRARALELTAEVPGFEEAWTELLENASTCDWFSSVPPETMSLPAQALGRSLGWLQFREAELNTYFVHEARQRFSEISERAARRVREGLPAYEEPEPKALPGEVAELLEGIGAPTQETIPPPAGLFAKFRRRHGLAPPATDILIQETRTVKVGAALADPLTEAQRAERKRAFDALVEAEQRKATADQAWRTDEPSGL
jgi:hypothetical protein